MTYRETLICLGIGLIFGVMGGQMVLRTKIELAERRYWDARYMAIYTTQGEEAALRQFVEDQERFGGQR